MLRRRTRPKMGTREQMQIRCPSHLKWVRGHVCASGTPNCEGRIEAAHVRIGTNGGMSFKPGDNYAVPLCSFHHRCQHAQGEKTFWGQQHVDPIKLADELWTKSPHGIKWRREHDSND